MRKNFSILVADCNHPNLKKIKSFIKHYNNSNYKLDSASTELELLKKAEKGRFDLALINQEPPEINGMKMLDEINKRQLNLPVIIIIDEGAEKLGIKAINQGAYDYLTRYEIETDALNRAIHRALHRKKLEDDIKKSLKKLEKMVIRDGLTGLYNHKHLKEILKTEFKQAKRHVQPLSCIMLDLDHFKAVNDSYGHQFGDFVLVKSAEILQKLVRDTDFVARYGGEEFFVVLPSTDAKGALILAERIRKGFAKNTFRKENISIKVTISAGISSTSDTNAADFEDMMANTDKALYNAKWSGRNNVCMFEEIRTGDKAHPGEETKQIENFFVKLDDFNENIKDSCIESAHTIFQELKSGWGNINEHSVRVSEYIEELTKSLSMSREERNIVKRAALLHDVGMIGISSHILQKKGKLSGDEYNLVKRHSNIGVKLIERTNLFHRELPLILSHHERFDGTGYPQKLKGNNIPYGARVLAVAEAYDAMVSDTFYNEATSSKAAITELKSCAGTQFDPKIVDTFVKMIDK